MFLKNLNNFKNLDYKDYYEFALALLAGILVFRKPATIAIILFILFNLIYYKKLVFKRKNWISILLIAIPVLLDILFLWNNDSIPDGFKHMEKRISTFLFPLFIISQSFSLNLNRLLRLYTYVFSGILFILFIRFCVLFPDLVFKYLKGIELWEMGYSFANSTTVHAPALNMHVAFLVVASFYLVIQHFFKTKSVRAISVSGLVFGWAFVLLLIINTRLAIVNAIIGLFLVLYMELVKKVSRKTLIKSTIILSASVLVCLYTFAEAFPYVKQKFTTVTFANMDMVGRLDEFEDPEGTVFNSFVTRVSIWKTAWERSQDDLWLGVGAADGKDQLNQAYIDTNQQFLAKYKFPTHNQYLDFLLKFGILGFIGVLFYMLHILWIGWKLQHSVVIFFFILFFTSNLTDDFLIRFDGITFSALWISIFAAIYYGKFQESNQLAH